MADQLLPAAEFQALPLESFIAAPLRGAIEEETGWKVVVGPEDSREIGNFLQELKKK